MANDRREQSICQRFHAANSLISRLRRKNEEIRSGKNYRPTAKMFDSSERRQIDPAAAE
jgi:hypothetical protein